MLVEGAFEFFHVGTAGLIDVQQFNPPEENLPCSPILSFSLSVGVSSAL